MRKTRRPSGANDRGHILFIRTLILAACKCRQADSSPPKSPHWLWQRLTYFVLSIWGLVLHCQPAVYACIAKSLWHFPDRVALRHELSHAGFTVVSSQQFCCGTLELITGTKQVAEPESASVV